MQPERVTKELKEDPKGVSEYEEFQYTPRNTG